jgi:glycerol-3-phosphate acyltransferase PlsY
MSTNDVLRLLAVTGAGYLLGSIPSGVILGHLWKGIDIRRHGSTHTGGLNTLRVVGVPAGVLAGLCDAAKGAGAVLLAQTWGPEPWSVPLAGCAAVVGHNWSLFLGFQGGLGLATLAGSVILFRPQAILLAILVYGVLFLVLRNRPRAAAVAVLNTGALLWAVGASESLIALGVLGGAASFVKHALEIKRGYGTRSPIETPAEGDFAASAD